ncbi:vitamin K epoxide reductase complex subunit 1 isoform X2 [Eurytemora carolleeae]|uniref:vitamin K epoxide reductase complex subunit 1 isoform X2 n=1 Tax=Eurytemora carolleeae TaxID=1294199 RepID=UPI000C7735C2|nr:vitamin K epoxide reductase complex subunit 1 isoform X2 [Eurytemora carolleeae]|eukprot:XP_023326457.1 vitamin K epoxide reductase complex subunit 1-like isoform X2 [Eurytemora affinis]
MTFETTILSLTGLGLSIYTFYVETKAKSDEEYSPLCDIDSYISCSKVFKTKFAKGFGMVGDLVGEEHPLNQPNCVYGIIFYLIFLLLSFINRRFIATFQVLLSLGACGVSLYLGYLLYFVIQAACVVCIASYAVNLLLLLFSFCKRRALAPQPLKADKYGYYIPTTHMPTNNNFKKFI